MVASPSMQIPTAINNSGSFSNQIHDVDVMRTTASQQGPISSGMAPMVGLDPRLDIRAAVNLLPGGLNELAAQNLSMYDFMTTPYGNNINPNYNQFMDPFSTQELDYPNSFYPSGE